MRWNRGALAVLALVLAARCASSPTSRAPAPEPITPADFVASVIDVASGRNESMAEAGLVLKRIEFRLAVGRQASAGAKLEVLLLDAEASRASETAFVQEFTLEVPAGRGRSTAAKALVPGVAEFVESAMNTARDLARVATAAQLPQRLNSVELSAKITRSGKLGGGISASLPSVVKPSLGVDLGKSFEEENTVRLLFEAR